MRILVIFTIFLLKQTFCGSKKSGKSIGLLTSLDLFSTTQEANVENQARIKANTHIANKLNNQNDVSCKTVGRRMAQRTVRLNSNIHTTVDTSKIAAKQTVKQNHIGLHADGNTAKFGAITVQGSESFAVSNRLEIEPEAIAGAIVRALVGGSNSNSQRTNQGAPQVMPGGSRKQLL